MKKEIKFNSAEFRYFMENKLADQDDKIVWVDFEKSAFRAYTEADELDIAKYIHHYMTEIEDADIIRYNMVVQKVGDWQKEYPNHIEVIFALYDWAN